MAVIPVERLDYGVAIPEDAFQDGGKAADRLADARRVNEDAGSGPEPV